MYICKKCGAVYEDDEVPSIVNEFGYEFHTFTDERLGDCSCGGELVEAEECAECGKIVPEDEGDIDENGDFLCRKCFEKFEEAQDDAG